ncbi:cytochrome P450 [Trametes punicea]|nr:cytochrome P450 [Trametes punicea]
MSWYSIAGVFVISILLLFYLRSVANWQARARGRPLPPGPRRLPIVGNLFNAPSSWKPWVGFRRLIAEFGEMVYLEVLGQSMLILGSPAVMFDLLDKHSSITSDRAFSPLISLAGHDFNLGFMPYGQWWRRHRRSFWQQFHPGVVSRYRPLQQAAVNKFLVKLLDKPKSCQELIRFCISAAAFNVVYGVEINDEQDERITLLDDVVVGLRNVTVSVQFLLEFIPVLRHLPPSTPWIGKVLKEIAASKAPNVRLVEDEFAEAKTHVVRTHLLARMSHTSQLQGASQEEEKITKQVAASHIFDAAICQIFSTAQGFFLAMALYPEVQRKAHAELDAVVGPHRLPDYSDMEALVYISAIVKESLRWHNVIPLGVGHKTTADVDLRGYFIPAGTTVVPNVWSCMHDPEIYPDPDRFNPDRFILDEKLDPDVLDPATMAFGFGRRICPGRYFAEAGLFIMIASVLHVFEIHPPVDEHGRAINMKYEQSHGLMSYPEDFECIVKPRSADAEALILGLRAGSTSAAEQN